MKTTNKIKVAAQWVLNEKVIAYPTEGVWGIGGLNLPHIVNSIGRIKSRPTDKKYILLLSSLEELTQRFNIKPEYNSLIEQQNANLYSLPHLKYTELNQTRRQTTLQIPHYFYKYKNILHSGVR